MGSAILVRTASTPAIIVVATAPIPTLRTPSFPFGSAIGIAFFATFLILLNKIVNYGLEPSRLCFANRAKIATDFVSALDLQFRRMRYGNGLHLQEFSSSKAREDMRAGFLRG
jgi:hypothetical protein